MRAPAHIIAATFLVLLAVLAFPLANADTQTTVLELNTDSSAISLTPYLAVYEDKSRTITLEELRKQPVETWQPTTSKTPNFGYSGSAFWVKWTILTSPRDLPEWLLDFPAPLTDDVALYVLENDLLRTSYVTGDALPFIERPIKHRNFLFPLSLKPDREYEFYLRIAGKNSMFAPLTLWKNNEFWENSQLDTIIIYVYSGAMLIMVLYNLLIGFSLQKTEYVFYCGLILTFTLFNASAKGVLFQFATFDLPDFNQIVIPLTAGLIPLFSSMFTLRFLDISRQNDPIKWYILHGFALVAAICILVVPWTPYASITQTIIYVTYAFYLFAAACSIGRVLSGFGPARFFLLGWSAVIAGYVTFAITKLGLISSNLLTENSILLGSAIEATLFALALAYRMKNLEQDRLVAEHALLSTQQELNTSLEQKVSERTKELERLKSKFEQASITDELTGLHNRRHYNDVISKEFSRHRRDAVVMNFCIFDLDNFKRYNDRYGHPAGDKLLADIGGLVRKHFQRGADFCFRLGGEEFGILFPSRNAADAQEVIEQFRQDIIDQHWPHADNPGGVVTASFGLLSITNFSETNVDQLYIEADEALYEAKENGRNCIKNRLS